MDIEITLCDILTTWIEKIIEITFNHGEVSEAVRRRGMGDAGGERCMRGSRNGVGKELHIEMEGKSVAVGGAMSLN